MKNYFKHEHGIIKPNFTIRYLLMFFLGISTIGLYSQNKDSLFAYTGSVQTYTMPAGDYLLEVWGAQGSASPNNGYYGGTGGYSQGVYTTSSQITFNIYVGGVGRIDDFTPSGGWNGGGDALRYGGGGGGGTDIRIGGVTLSDRVIVAGGGGGAYSGTNRSNGGYGGGLIAGAGSYMAPAGTQVSGYALGQGEAAGASGYTGGAGGGGYYGGYAGTTTYGSGAGGSAYIGGVSAGQTRRGETTMPDPNGGTMLGNESHGYVKITQLCDGLTYSSNPTTATPLCPGSQVTLSATSTNGGTVTWDKGIVNGISFTIDSTITYIATSTYIDDCVLTKTIIVGDITAPEAPILADVIGECTATATVPTTTDACVGTITGNTADALTYTTKGTHVITWNFDDGNGNSIDVDQNVIVNDSTNVTTQGASNVSKYAATLNGNVTDLGCVNPISHGFCWNISGTPTITDNKTDKGTAHSTGAFTSRITGLTANLTFHVRSYVTNAYGTEYGNEVSFSSTGIVSNNALVFDGVDDYVDCGTIDLSLQSFTIECWVKTENLNAVSLYEADFCGIANGINNAMVRTVSKDGGSTYVFEFFTTEEVTQSFKIVTGSIPVEENEWYHVAAVYDNTDGAKKWIIYVNGIQDGYLAEAGTNDNYSNGPFKIGGAYFDGEIDEVRIWNDVRTQAEIRQNMYQELSAPLAEANLVACYAMNETAGTSLEDVKDTYGGTLTNMAGTEWKPSSAFFGSKGCLDFDGVDDNVWCSTLSPTVTSGTIEFWINLDQIPTNNARVISTGADYHSGDEVYLTQNNGRIATTGSFVIGDDLLSTNPLEIDVWTHVAITADGSGSKLFINGILNDEGGAAAFSLSSFRIGGQYTAGYWETVDGMMDEVRVWNDVRTELEIRENMNRPLSGNESNLVAYYNFDNTSGATLQSFPVAGNDGVLGGMTDANWIPSHAFNNWLNTNSATWSDASNWSGGVPVSSDNLGIYDFTGVSPEVTGGTTVKDVIVGNATSITMSDNITITGNLILNNDLDLNGQTINLGADAMLIEENGYLTGNSGQIQTTRNLNNIDEDIAGLGVTITTTEDMGATTIVRKHSATSSSISRQYHITPANNSGLNATLTIAYLDSELNGNNEADLELFRSTDGGTEWVEQSASTVNTADNTLTIISLDGFSYWTAAEAGTTVLPIELLYFEVECSDGELLEFSWATASELNNSHFEIQKSIDGQSFETVYTVNGAGTSNSVLHYEIALDKDNSEAYYRLKQVDYDGQFTYSDLVYPNCSASASKLTEVKIYPNPFTSEIFIDLGEQNTTDLIIEVRNSLGVLMLVDKIEEQNSNHTLRLNSDLPAGLYVIMIISDTEIVNRKVIKE